MLCCVVLYNIILYHWIHLIYPSQIVSIHLWIHVERQLQPRPLRMVTAALTADENKHGQHVQAEDAMDQDEAGQGWRLSGYSLMDYDYVCVCIYIYIYIYVCMYMVIIPYFGDIPPILCWNMDWECLRWIWTKMIGGTSIFGTWQWNISHFVPWFSH